MRRFKITDIDTGVKQLEVWDDDGEQIIDELLEYEDSERYGDEIPGLKNFSYRENIESLASFLNDWECDEDIADEIIAELDSWIAEVSLSEQDALKRDIAEWDARISGHTEALKRHMKRIDELNEQMNEIRRRIDNEARYAVGIQAEINRFRGYKADLENQLKEV